MLTTRLRENSKWESPVENVYYEGKIKT